MLKKCSNPSCNGKCFICKPNPPYFCKSPLCNGHRSHFEYCEKIFPIKCGVRGCLGHLQFGQRCPDTLLHLPSPPPLPPPPPLLKCGNPGCPGHLDIKEKCLIPPPPPPLPLRFKCGITGCRGHLDIKEKCPDPFLFIKDLPIKRFGGF